MRSSNSFSSSGASDFDSISLLKGVDSRCRRVSPDVSEDLGGSGTIRNRIGLVLIMFLATSSDWKMRRKAFGIGVRGWYYAHVSQSCPPRFRIAHTFKDRNIVTSPNRSKTRRTSRRSVNVRGVGCILTCTVRAAIEPTLEIDDSIMDG